MFNGTLLNICPRTGDLSSFLSYPDLMTQEFGQRIREARLRRGLTQQEVACGIVSAPFLSMVESGRREPSSEVLARLAERLDLDLSVGADSAGTASLIAIRTGLARARVAVETGDCAGALQGLDGIDRLFARVDGSDLRAEFHYWRGRAQEGLSQLDSAIRELTSAVEIAALRGSAFREIEMGIDLVRCLRVRGDLSAALERATRLKGRLPVGLEGSPLLATLTATMIELHFARGDHPMALLLADGADGMAAGESDPIIRALALCDASLASEERKEAALLLASEATRLMAVGGDAAALGRLQATAAWLYMRVSPPNIEAAAERLAAARNAFGTRIGAADSAKLHAETARLRWLRSDFVGARAEALAALNLLEGQPENEMTADPHLVAARAEAGLGDMDASRMHFREAQRILGGSQPSRATSIGWRELGDVYLELGHGEDAVLAYQQALSDAGLRVTPVEAVAAAGAPLRH
jgi:transcriptional regulator with XRE-family HTH domain